MTLFTLCGLLHVGVGVASSAATLENACALVFEKLYANIAARGEIVALIPSKGEVIIEFVDDLVPLYGAELLVFAGAPDDLPETTVAEGDHESGPNLIFRGSVTVSESAGHLNRAYVVSGSEALLEGDQVFLPTPVQLYITPLKNLTPYSHFTAQATAAITRMLATLPGVDIFNLPASNQKTVDFLLEKCRNQGRYGLIVQPYILLQNNRSKVQIRLSSLYSGDSLGVLSEKFTIPMAPPSPQVYNQYRALPPAR
ncbi:hypothetical protein KAI46_15390 [bacterium]|nr:hypothetical protein [bacterium]